MPLQKVVLLQTKNQLSLFKTIKKWWFKKKSKQHSNFLFTGIIFCSESWETHIIQAEIEIEMWDPHRAKYLNFIQKLILHQTSPLWSNIVVQTCDIWCIIVLLNEIQISGLVCGMVFHHSKCPKTKISTYFSSSKHKFFAERNEKVEATGCNSQGCLQYVTVTFLDVRNLVHQSQSTMVWFFSSLSKG